MAQQQAYNAGRKAAQTSNTAAEILIPGLFRTFELAESYEAGWNDGLPPSPTDRAVFLLKAVRS
jgi:hypothetical protein